jgi:hypothetical protein
VVVAESRYYSRILSEELSGTSMIREICLSWNCADNEPATHLYSAPVSNSLTLCNTIFFYGGQIAPQSNPKLEGYLLSPAHNCMLNIFI